MAIDSSFGYWLAGFSDGEACFTINRLHGSATGWNYQPRFTIMLRDDDTAILEECRERTGIGKVSAVSATKLGNPQTQWVVYTKPDVLVLTEIFDWFPLRSKKARDYAIWREAVMLWQTLRIGGRSGWSRGVNAVAYAHMAALRDSLMTGRIYTPNGHSVLPIVRMENR